MRTVEHIREFLDTFVAWASAQAMALVGSYARGAAKDDSDIDLVILTDRPQTYLEMLSGQNVLVVLKTIRLKIMGN